MVEGDCAFVLSRYFHGEAFERKEITDHEYCTQRGLIAELFGYRLWSTAFLPELVQQAAQIMRRDVTPGFVATELIVWLNDHQIVRPGYTTLQELIGTALSAMIEDRLPAFGEVEASLAGGPRPGDVEPRGRSVHRDVGSESPSVPQSKSELEEFFDLALDLMVIVGFDGYFKRVNPAYERTLGYPLTPLFFVAAAWLVDLIPGERRWRTAPRTAPWWNRAGDGLTAICAALAVSPCRPTAKSWSRRYLSASRRDCAFTICCAYNPLPLDEELEIDRLKRKVDSGADLVYTQPVFDEEGADKAVKVCSELNMPVFVGLLPLRSQRHSEFMHDEGPVIRVPEWLRKRMAEAADDTEALKIGVEEAQKLAQHIRKIAQGLYLMPPAGSHHIAECIVEAI